MRLRPQAGEGKLGYSIFTGFRGEPHGSVVEMHVPLEKARSQQRRLRHQNLEGTATMSPMTGGITSRILLRRCPEHIRAYAGKDWKSDLRVGKVQDLLG